MCQVFFLITRSINLHHFRRKQSNMHASNKNCIERTVGLVAVAAIIVVIVMSATSSPVECQQSGVGAFGSSRPGSTLFEPTMAFIRQNMKLVEQYVALFRSIFVGPYERPMITSTDAPGSRGSTRAPSPSVPPMDLPTANRRHHH